MNRLLLSALILVGVCLAASADPPPANPGADVLHYTFRLNLNDQSDEVAGEAEIAVRFVADGIADLNLDLVGMTVAAVKENGRPADFAHEKGRLRIRLGAPSRTGEQRTYTVSYHGVPADGLIISKNKYGDRTFFADHWPNRARCWLPTVDDPRDKAACDFIVVAPARYQAVANGRLAEQTDLPDGLRRTHWTETVPIPTKVMAIGVARFAVQYLGECNGKSVQTWVYPQDREAGFRNLAPAAAILKFFDERIGPYPYEKLANVESKTRYGGMENAGCIFYAEDAVTGGQEIEDVLAHEIAHQWFGDSVTEADWRHIWLSEGFATYLADVYIEQTLGRGHMIERMKKERAALLEYLRAQPGSTVVDSTITEPIKLLNANSYLKGAWFLHMLRHVVGEKAFWDGLRAFYARYRDGNALTEDFQKTMERGAGRDLSWLFQEWLYQPGDPKYDGTWHYDATAKRLTVTLNQTQANVFRMPVDLGIFLQDGKPPRIERLQVDQKTNAFSFPLDTAPASVILDPDTWVLMEADFRKN